MGALPGISPTLSMDMVYTESQGILAALAALSLSPVAAAFRSNSLTAQEPMTPLFLPGMPYMASAAVLAWRRAGPARGSFAGLRVSWLYTSTASPTA